MDADQEHPNHRRTVDETSRTSPVTTDNHGLGGQRAVVIGGAGLIGSAICGSLIRSGIEVLAVDRDAEALGVLAQRHRGLQTERADISDPAGRSFLQRTFATFDATHLIQAAGWRYAGGPKRRFDHREWSEVVNVNLISPVYLAEQFIDALRQRNRNGSITFISSVHARVVLGDPSYSAAKAGLETAVRELARTAARSGIRVNAVAPGHVATAPDGSPVPSRPTTLGGEALPPETIATAVHFLTCGHCSPHTTGVTLTVDGGLSLTAPWMRD